MQAGLSPHLSLAVDVRIDNQNPDVAGVHSISVFCHSNITLSGIASGQGKSLMVIVEVP